MIALRNTFGNQFERVYSDLVDFSTSIPFFIAEGAVVFYCIINPIAHLYPDPQCISEKRAILKDENDGILNREIDIGDVQMLEGILKANLFEEIR